MIKRLKSLCGEIHFSTLLVCGGCIFPVYRSHPEIADMLEESEETIEKVIEEIKKLKHS